MLALFSISARSLHSAPASPRLNLLVIRAADLEASKAFYETLGLRFTKHQHGSGAEHYAAEEADCVFEIYPLSDEPSTGARLGFSVGEVDRVVATLREKDYRIASTPKDSPWGRRAVVLDPDGHRVELTSLSHGL